MTEAGLYLGTLSISHGMSASIIVFPENTEFLSSGEKAGSWQKVNYLELINCYVSYKIFHEIVTQRLKLSMMSPNTFLDILLLISFHISLTLESLWGLLEYPNRAAPAPLPPPLHRLPQGEAQKHTVSVMGGIKHLYEEDDVCVYTTTQSKGA